MAVRQNIIDFDRKLVESIINQLIRWIYEIKSFQKPELNSRKNIL